MSERRLNPIAWTEGMFLRPHHLQQHELSIQARLDYHLRAADPFHWGVREFAVNEEALSERRVEIQRLDCVLPGGAIVRYPGNAVVEVREFPAASQFVDVHIGLRRLSPNRPNSSALDNGAKDVRYKIRAENFPDLERGGFEVPVEVLLPNVRVFLSGEEEELETHESLRLLRVEATGEIKRPFGLSRTCSPPLLALQAYAPLEEEVRAIVAQIAAKVAVVAARTETIAVGELPRMWMRYTLARMTPVLRQLLATGETRPFALYTALVETAGALGAFKYKEPPDLPAYEHADPFPSFRRLLDQIDAELEEAAPRFTELRLAYDAQRKAYVTDALTVDLVDPRNRFTLAVKASMESAELARWVLEKAKASSARHVGTLVTLALPGLGLEKLPGEPTDIAGPPGAEYWKLEPYGDKWAKVREEFTLALSLGALADADVRLYVVRHE